MSEKPSKLFSALSLKIRSSFIFSKLNRLVERLHTEQKAYFTKHSNIPKKISAAKRTVSLGFAQSKLFAEISKLRLALLKTSLRSYGIGVLFFGLYSTAITVMKQYLSGQFFYADASIITGIICILVSFFMLSCPKTLIFVLCESNSFSPIIDSVMHIRTDDILSNVKHIKSFNIPLVIGTVFGLLAFFTSPQRIIFCIFIFIAVMLLLVSPEFGISAAVLLFPFLSQKSISAVIIAIFISYAIKYIRGKRIFGFGIIGFMPFAVGAVGIIRCATASKGSPIGLSFAIAMPVLYLLVLNMFRTKRLADSLSKLVAASFFIVFAARVLYCIANATGFEIACAGFICDCNAIGKYLALTLGFAMYAAVKQASYIRKVQMYFMISLFITFTVITGDTVSAVASAVTVITFALCSAKSESLNSVPALAIMPIAYIIFSQNPTVKNAVSVFMCDDGSAVTLCAKDLLFIFGIGGAVLTVLFFVLSFAQRLSVRSYIDGSREIYAAVGSAFICAFFCLAAGIDCILPSSLLLIITLMALFESMTLDNFSNSLKFIKEPDDAKH